MFRRIHLFHLLYKLRFLFHELNENKEKKSNIGNLSKNDFKVFFTKIY